MAGGHTKPVVADQEISEQDKIKQADALHLRYFMIRGSVDLAEALLKTKDYTHARQELDNALRLGEKLGLRLETARIYYFLGETLRLTGNAQDAAVHYKQARTMFDNLKQEPGAEHLVERPDLRDMYNQTSQAVVAAK